MPRAAATPSVSAPQVDEVSDALDQLGDPDGVINVYRIQPNGKRAFSRAYQVGEFSEQAVSEHLGGGAYFAQAKGRDGRLGRGASFEIDASIRPARRVMPPTPTTYQPTDPYAAFTTQQPADPVLAALGAMSQRLERIEQGRASGQMNDAPTWRDLMASMQTQQPVGGATEIMKLLPTFVEMMKPKSSIEELFAAAKLMKFMGRSGLADQVGGEEGGGGGLGELLNGPIAQALAAKFLSSDAPTPAARPARPSVATQPALPQTAASMQTPPPPTPPTTTAAATPSPQISAELVATLQKHVPLLIGIMEATPTITGVQIAELIMGNVPEEQAEQLFAQIDPLPEGALAQIIAGIEPKLRTHANAMKLIIAEGVLREALRPVPIDETDTEEEAEQSDEPPATYAFTPATPVPVATAQPVAAPVQVETSTPLATAPKPRKSAKPVPKPKGKK